LKDQQMNENARNTPLRIIELQAENVKRLRAVHIKPKGTVVQITGRNGEGKTSVLDAIQMAILGKGVQPPEPIRRGTSSALVLVDLGDIIIKRTWTAGGDTRVVVESKDGARYPKPQEVLSALGLFDPVAFCRMKPVDQVVALKRLANLDFDELDARRASFYEQRRDVNRELKAQKARLVGIPEDGIPDEEINIAELLRKQKTAFAQKQQNDTKRQLAHDRESEVGTLKAAIAGVTKEQARRDLEWVNSIERLEREIEEARRKRTDEHEDFDVRLGDIRVQLETATKEAAATATESAKLIDPDIDALQQQITEAEKINIRVRAKRERSALAEEVAALDTQSATLTGHIDAIDAEKIRMMQAAKLGVPKLGIDRDGRFVTLNELPFEQASSREQLITITQAAFAAHPRLRIVLIENGSLLDSGGMATLEEVMIACEGQAWIERVSDGPAGGVYIENGFAIGDETVAIAELTGTAGE
jgi:predicted ATP-dependent endonuclease of OLD family